MDRWERDVVKIVAEVKDVQSEIKAQLLSLREEVKDEMAAVKAEHVSLDRFRPVERIAYGVVVLICSAVVGALIKLVLIP